MNSDKIGLNISKIRNTMDVTGTYTDWETIHGANCYAYALGLDVRESLIVGEAYQPGTIGMLILHRSLYDISNMCVEERMKLDLRALNIKFKEVSKDELFKYKEYYNKDGLVSSTTYSWPVALFMHTERKGYFHFVRREMSGQWSHKLGYKNEPEITDYDKKIITDPEACNLGKYEYRKTYLLTLNKKIK